MYYVALFVEVSASKVFDEASQGSEHIPAKGRQETE
jgi:hypothetical protein